MAYASPPTTAVLTLGQSDLRQGFPAALRLGVAGGPLRVVAGGMLPVRPELYQIYADWAAAYRRAGLPSSVILAAPQYRNGQALKTCLSLGRQLREGLNDWLRTESFVPVWQGLADALVPRRPIRLLINTDNARLRRIPWSLWDLCDRTPHLEIALSLSSPILSEPRVSGDLACDAATGLRTLLVVSNGQGVDWQREEETLGQLPGVDVHLLVEPGQPDWQTALQTGPWDLLLVTGTRPDGAPETGRIYLNPTTSLTVETLRSHLTDLKQRGLGAAALNACDGQGLARSLDVGLPQLITFREPVPDRVAYLFFKVLLRALAQGGALSTAVRQARAALQRSKFPCGGWLPVMFQHPAGALQPSMAARRSPHFSPAELTEPISDVTEIPPEESQQAAVSGLINHRYRICRILGRGGFGETYLATDAHRFEERCVLKRFSPNTTSPASLRKARELFQREAKVLYQIDHPQIPKFLAWFTHEEHLFIVQEYIEGQSYLDLLRDRQQRGQTFTETEIVQWLLDLLPVLEYLHNLGLVHRDISPANIMHSTAKQKPILIDFGVVKEVVSQILSGQQSSFVSPPRATLVGKPGYSPPEQVRLGDCYPCSDLYALGVTAIVLLTGQDPRWLLDLEVAAAAWRPQARIGDGLAAILTKMTMAQPRERYQSAEDILTDLRRRLPSPRPLPPSEGRLPAIAPGRPTSVNRPLGAPLENGGGKPDALDGDSSSTASLPASPTFVARCREELAPIIGPMAGFLIDDLLTDDPGLTETDLVEAIASEIPDGQLADQFRRRIENL